VEHPDRLAALEQLLSPYTIVEAVRTGRVAMTRASVAHDESRAPLRILG
jgi:acetolactate synthase small subunit